MGSSAVVPFAPAKKRDSDEEFLVVLDMRAQTVLGLDVDWTDKQTLYIKSVQAGAILDWNRGRGFSDQTVKPGGRIIEVNGFRGDPVAMASLVRELSVAKGMLRLVVRAPSMNVPAAVAPKVLNPPEPSSRRRTFKEVRRSAASDHSDSNDS